MKITMRRLRNIIREAILLEGNRGTKSMKANQHLDRLDIGRRVRRGDFNGNDVAKEIQRKFPDISDSEADEIASDYVESQY